MRLNVGAASASAILITSFLPVAAIAADSASLNLAQTAGAPNPNGALGISPNPANNTPNTLQLPAPELPTSAPPLTGLFPSTGSTLLDHGIDIHGLLYDRFNSNVSSGIAPGRAGNLGGFLPQIDINLGKLVGIPGGTIHFRDDIWALKYNSSAFTSQTGGILTGYQISPEPAAVGNEIATLTYEQQFTDAFSVEAGKTNLYRYFLITNGLDPATYVSTTMYADGDFAPPAHSTWGGRATYRLPSGWYVQGGAFEDNYRQSIYQSYNFTDKYYSAHAAGVQVIGEVAYRSEFNTAAYPSNMEVGVMYGTRNGGSNKKGTGGGYTPILAPVDYPGGAVLFAQGAKVVWRGPALSRNAPPKNIQLYGSFDVAAGKPQPIDLDAVAGINFTGFVPLRPADAFGLQVHYQRLSQIEGDFESRSERRFAGPGPGQPRDGFGFEVVGQVKVTPWATVTPFVEYFVNPDAYYNPLQHSRPRDGFYVGVLSTISIGPLLGTSRKPS